MEGHTTGSGRRGWTGQAARLVVGLLLLVVLGLAHPVLHLGLALARDPARAPAPPPGTEQDASRLDAVPVAEVVPLARGAEAAVAQVRELLARARAEGRVVSIAGARHSMGGHTLFPGGLVLSTGGLDGMSLDPERHLLTVGAGARWTQVLPFLAARGLSVAVMQSFASFTVGGSLSVNCHGIQPARPPIASTVESFRIMLADGSVRRCSRSQDAELFSLALGGYGLFGVILDAELRVVPDEAYRSERRILPVAELVDAIRALHDDPGVGLVYTRLSVDPATWLQEGIVQAFRRTGEASPSPGSPTAGDGAFSRSLKRSLYLGSIGSDYGKQLRWSIERRLGETLGGSTFTRNGLLAEEVDTYENRSAASTDVLLEFFLPPDRFLEFVAALRDALPASGVDLLNLTVRDVRRDPDTVLAYARQDVLAAVLYLNVPCSPEGDGRLGRLTRTLVEAALLRGGTYYLPYRLHPSPEQLLRAYPAAPAFFARKRAYDPEERFQSLFYQAYGRIGQATGG